MLVNRLARGIRGLLGDGQVRLLLRRSGMVLYGNGAGALLNLLAMALAARALGVEAFGTLSLVIAYVLLIEGIVNLNSWQALIKFGSAAIHRAKDEVSLGAFVKLSLLVDLISHGSGVLISIAGVALFGGAMEWSEDAKLLALIYSVVVLTHARGTAIGILRLFGDFRVISFQGPLSGGVTLAGFAYLYFVQADLSMYLYVQLASDVCVAAYIYCMAWRTSKRHGVKVELSTGFAEIRGQVREYLKFLLITNVTSTVNLIFKRADILIVGLFLGDAGAGLFRIAKLFARVPNLVFTPLYQAIYPQLSKLISEDKYIEFRQLAQRAAILGAVPFVFYWVGFVLFGKWVIEVVFGSDYVSGWSVTVVYLLGIVIGGMGLPLTPGLLAIGRPGRILYASICATVCNVLALVLLLPWLGLIAVGLASLVFYSVWGAIMLINLRVSFNEMLARIDTREPSAAKVIGSGGLG